MTGDDCAEEFRCEGELVNDERRDVVINGGFIGSVGVPGVEDAGDAIACS